MGSHSGASSNGGDLTPASAAAATGVHYLRSPSASRLGLGVKVNGHLMEPDSANEGQLTPRSALRAKATRKTMVASQSSPTLKTAPPTLDDAPLPHSPKVTAAAAASALRRTSSKLAMIDRDSQLSPRASASDGSESTPAEPPASEEAESFALTAGEPKTNPLLAPADKAAQLLARTAPVQRSRARKRPATSTGSPLEDRKLVTGPGTSETKAQAAAVAKAPRGLTMIKSKSTGTGRGDKHTTPSSSNTRNLFRVAAKAATASTRTRKARAARSTQPGSRLVKRVEGADVRCAVVVDGEVWTATRDGDIVIRDIDGAEEVARVETHAVLSCMARVKSQIWAGTERGPILIFDAKRSARRIVAEARQHAGGVQCLEWDGGGRVWSGSSDFTCIEWDADTGEFVRMLSGHGNGVRCLLAVGAKYLWSGCDDDIVRVWDQGSGELLKELVGHRDSVLGLTVATMDLSRTQPVKAVSPTSDAPAPSPAFSVSGGGTMSNAFGLRDEGVAADIEARMEGLGLPNLATAVWSCSADGHIRAWSAAAPFSPLGDVDTGARVVAMMPMGMEIWSSGQTGDLHVWDSKSMKLKTTLKGHASFTSDVVRVKKRETQVLWSASMGDQTLNVYERNATEGFEQTELLAAAGAANVALTAAVERGNDEEERRMATEATLRERDDTIAQLEKDLNAEKKRADDAIEAAGDAAIVLNQLALAQEELQEAQEGRERAESRAAGLEAELGMAQDKVNELKQRYREAQESFRAQMESLRGDLAEVSAQRAELSAAHTVAEALRNANAKLQAELAEAKEAARREGAALQQERKAHAETDEQLRDECELTIRLQTRLQELDPNAFRDQLRSHELMVRSSRAELTLLKENLEAAKAREEHLKKRMETLDVYQLDSIARQMGEVETALVRLRKRVMSFSEASHIGNVDDKAKVGRFTADIAAKLADARRATKGCIEECLTDAQKYHIGTTANEGKPSRRERASTEGAVSTSKPSKGAAGAPHEPEAAPARDTATGAVGGAGEGADDDFTFALDSRTTASSGDVDESGRLKSHSSRF